MSFGQVSGSREKKRGEGIEIKDLQFTWRSTAKRSRNQKPQVAEGGHLVRLWGPPKGHLL